MGENKIEKIYSRYLSSFICRNRVGNDKPNRKNIVKHGDKFNDGDDIPLYFYDFCRWPIYYFCKKRKTILLLEKRHIYLLCYLRDTFCCVCWRRLSNVIGVSHSSRSPRYTLHVPVIYNFRFLFYYARISNLPTGSCRSFDNRWSLYRNGGNAK